MGDVMSSITVEFKFDIGDAVYFAVSTHDANSRPNRFVVYERLAQQYHHGIQKLYKVGGRNETVPEILLTTEEPEYRPASEAENCERIQRVHDEYAASRRDWSDMAKDLTKATEEKS